MGGGDSPDKRIDELNNIFNELIVDASELIKDLHNGVKKSLYSGILVLFMGWLILEDKIPSILSGSSDAVIWAGISVAGIIVMALVFFIDYYRMSKRYSRLFGLVRDLENQRR